MRFGWRAVLLVVLSPGVAACGATGRATQAGPASPTQPDYVQVVKKLRPSVVQIDAGQQTGSGVVFDSAGDIVTNAHVVGRERPSRSSYRAPAGR